MTTYENWRTERHPIAALASNVTDHLVAHGPHTFDALCSAFDDEAHQGAKPSELAEALALCFAVRQAHPKDDKWHATKEDDASIARRSLALDPFAPTPNALGNNGHGGGVGDGTPIGQEPDGWNEPPTGVESPAAKKKQSARPVAQVHDFDSIFAGQNLRK